MGYRQRLSGGAGVQVVLPFRADFTSFDVLLDERSGLWPPEGAVQELVRPMFSWVSSCCIVVALLQYIPAQLQVGRDVEASTVEDKPVVLGPFRETVGEAFGSCLLEVGETLQHLCLPGTLLADAVGKGVAKDRGGHPCKVLWTEDDLLAVIFSVGDVVVRHAGEGVGLGVGLSRTVDEREVEAGEVEGPSALSSAEVLCSAPVLKVAVVGDDLERLGKSFQEVPPVLEGLDDGEHLPVVDLVVAFSLLHGGRAECNGVPEIVFELL
jgi:hypothetical protein